MANNNIRVEYTVTKKIAVISTSAKGWTKELRLIKWGDNDPKYDIRDWAPDDAKMGKGVTFTKDELVALGKVIAAETKAPKAETKTAKTEAKTTAKKGAK